MTLADLLARMYERLNYQSVPAPAVTQRLTNLLNEAQRRILRTPGLNRLKATTGGLTFTSEPNRAIYGLPPALTRVLSITDRTNDRRLTPITLSELRGGDPGLKSAGTPHAYVPLGIRAIVQPPLNPTALWASSSIIEIGRGVRISGIRAGGFPVDSVEQALSSGPVRVQVGTFTDWVDLTSVTVTGLFAGAVTIWDSATGPNVLAQIAPQTWSAEYVCVQLVPMPQTAITYYVDGALKMPQMNDPTDVPVLPEDFHELLVYGALIMEYEKQDDPRLVMADRLYREGLSALKYHVSSQGDRPVFGGAPPIRTSRLGPWTPAD